MAASSPSLLLCFDFDGTLVHHESDPAFHPAMGDMLRDFRRRGAAWVVNTGRSLSQTLEGLAQHNIFMLPDYIIAQECEIYRPGFFRAWTDFGSWNSRARRAHDHFMEKHVRFLNGIQEHVRTQTHAEFLSGDLGQVGIVARDEAELDEICVVIEEWRAEQPDIGYHRNGRYLRFSHADFSKGTALMELARLLKVPRERIFAAGDNHNDLSMLDHRVAGCIACPSNSLDAVKAHVEAHGGYLASRTASEGMMESLNYYFPAGQAQQRPRR
ncbi:HAD superfamily hydrolase (TIGR01484 family) [Roseimicrobium gellanilyticum]|uniref:HAD superfamily hydrolase (TIGR01484 family) n=1 Tax=Roseimicrobium gellanilyticum TaxID=748857 RepID=A0A366H2I0_9BACT|nr:HAD-IIB family hydrolase [Roseimicrobium gellanilyticum]RBP36110.1 HAD superfamily hydrolase (TIGR01484 family) [Roseimicrobium gellanilyticum]